MTGACHICLHGSFCRCGCEFCVAVTTDYQIVEAARGHALTFQQRMSALARINLANLPDDAPSVPALLQIAGRYPIDPELN